MSRIAGNVLAFGPLLHRGIELRSLRQSFWDGYSVCSGLFWSERWWFVGVVAADGVRPCLFASSSLVVEDGILFIMDSVRDKSGGVAPFSFLLLRADLLFHLMSVCADIYWRTTQAVWARVLMFSVPRLRLLRIGRLSGVPHLDQDRFVGLVVRRPPRERMIPGSNPACAGIFSGSSHTSDSKIGTPVATLPGAWRYRVSAGTGRPGVSILWLGEVLHYKLSAVLLTLTHVSLGLTKHWPCL